MSTRANPPIDGFVASGFERVRDQFEQNFIERGELGAACCVYHRGQKVVDLWGGFRSSNRQEAWETDTLVLVFSTTKGIAAMAVAVALSRGLFAVDHPVAEYWPEFAQAGKNNITVRQLLSHQAGLCAIDYPLDSSVLADADKLADILARQKPTWSPGQQQGYHYLSLGLYESELIRRTDPQNRSLGSFLQDEICQPLGIEFHIGLPPGSPEQRLAAIEGFKKSQMIFHLNKLPPKMVLSLMCPRTLTSRTLLNPHLDSPANLDSPEFRNIEVPAACGVGNARAIARAYSEFATGGHILGITPDVLAELEKPATPPLRGRYDSVMKIDMSFSLGFMKPFPSLPFGESETAFGCPGAGGSFGFADPDHELGFAYVMNKMGFHVFDDPRERALRDACYGCIR